MVASGTVTSDLNNINSVFTKLNDAIGGIGSSWEGLSRDNAENQINTFISNYKPNINAQMQAFAAALDLYVKYVEIKNRYKVAEEAYLADESDTSKKQLMNDLANQMRDLKAQIEEKLALVSNYIVVGAEAAPSVNASMAEAGFDYYNQQKYKDAYAGETIAIAGCAPTSMAMVVSFLKDDTITPKDAATLSEKLETVSIGGGTDRSFFVAAASKYGVDCNRIENPSVDDIINNLKEGRPIIVRANKRSSVNGDAWAGKEFGHYLVLTGIDENGKVSVADPWWDRRDEGYKYDPVQIDKAISDAWIF